MERRRLPQCRPGKTPASNDRRARRAIARLAQGAETGWHHYDEGNCRQAYRHLVATDLKVAEVGCYTTNLSHEQRRRLAKRFKFAQKRVVQLSYAVMGSCLRDKPDWTGVKEPRALKAMLWTAAGKPPLSGLGKVTPRDMRKLIRTARRQRWRVDRTRKGHYRFCPPDPGECVITSGTPGSPRVIRHAIANLRRAGLEV
jgi:hypothetical protein